MTTSTSPRIQELLDFAQEEGIELPYPAADIALVERIGGTVDLITGKIEPRGDERRPYFPTPTATAWVNTSALSLGR